MNRKTVCAVVVLLALGAGFAFADLGENFEQAGVGIAGGGSFYYDFGPILMDPKPYESSWQLSVQPEVDFFMIERLALYLAPYLAYSSVKDDADNIYRDMNYGLDAGVLYYLLSDPKAQKGLVTALGASLGLYFFPGVGDLVAGVETTNDSMRTYLALSPLVRLYYFLNDRLAFFTGLSPRILYWLSYKYSSGTKVELVSDERLFLDMTVSFGFSYFIPRNKASVL